jgi:hypothetical protein
MSTESVLWNYIRDHVEETHFVRVENLVHPGTPDVSYCHVGYEGWMELKYRPTYPKDPIKTIAFGDDGLRVDQKIWIDDRVMNGGVVWIVAGIEKDVYFVHGRNAQRFNAWTVRELSRNAYTRLTRGSRTFSRDFLRILRGL